MSHIVAALFVMTLLVPTVSFGAGQAWLWRDDTGATHISGDRESIPPAFRAKSEPIASVDIQGSGIEYNIKTVQPTKDFRVPLETLGAGVSVETLFNGTQTRMAVLDTGAQWIVITRKLAMALGYDLKTARAGLFSSWSGAVSAPVVTLNSVSIGGAQARDIPAAVVDFDGRGPVSAIIGMSFLNGFRFEINARGGYAEFFAPR